MESAPTPDEWSSFRMFLRDFTDDQKRAFLSLANRVVLADWKVPAEEESMLVAITEELGADIVIGARELFSPVDLTSFDTQPRRRLLIFELLLVAEADNILQRGEVEIIQEVADSLGFDAATVENLRVLAHEHHIHKRAALGMHAMAAHVAEVRQKLGF